MSDSGGQQCFLTMMSGILPVQVALVIISGDMNSNETDFAKLLGHPVVLKGIFQH